mmetsp:Transcript_31797/g.66839  ORF Transcript_31797/g.66839 Transcript_31797/m.66839 type:complete len:86 (-) Transcript_31797:183-440(-)
MVWAYATAKMSDHQMFEKVAAVIDCHGLRLYNTQELSNVVWAFATAKISSQRLFDKVAYEIIQDRDLTVFKPLKHGLGLCDSKNV